MSYSFQALDSADVGDADLTRYHEFESAIRAERLPEDPPLPFGASVRQLRRPGPNARTRGFAAVLDGQWIGVSLGVVVDSDERNVRVDLAVLPEYRRRGIGTELLARVAQVAEEAGRDSLVGDTYDRVTAGAAFARRFSASPGLRGHINRLALGEVDRAKVRRMIADGPVRAPAYELVAFDSPIPDEHIDDIAAMITVINDAPTDDLETAPIAVNGEMVRAFERIGLAAGVEVWWLLAREKSTGFVVGETDVRWDPKQPETVTQGYTVVRNEHRGHALGKWLKATMLERVLDERPDAVDVRTTNADSNAPMLGINKELGYKPYVATTTWQMPTGAALAPAASPGVTVGRDRADMGSDLPLLEFDPDPVGVVDQWTVLADKRDTIPERVVLCFYAEVLAALPAEAVQVGELEAAHGVHPIWKITRHGTEVAVFHPGVGAPLAAAFLEEAIAMGARKVVACGGCGTLTDKVGAGEIVIPTSAVRDEGTSFHYLPPSREVEADPDGVAAAVGLLEERGVPFTAGKVWTTDAIYRETRQRVARRRAEGCLVVEMEAAAFFAVARFRSIRFAQLLYGGDDLSGDGWDARSWTVSPSRARTFDLAVELATRL